MTVSPRAELLTMKPYKAGRSEEEVRRDIEYQGAIIKLAQNEGADGLLATAREAVNLELDEYSHRYPVSAFPQLRQALADRHSVAASNILAGPGGTAVLGHLSSAYLNKGDEVVTGSPTFGWYKKFAQIMGAACIEVPLLADGAYDLDSMRSAVTERTKFVYVCSPNNPTGNIVSRERLVSFIDSLPPTVMVIIDEAYAEYVTDPDYCDAISEFVAVGKNVAVMRTFSKIFGMGGLRLGYIVVPDEVADNCSKVQNPYEISRLAIAAGIASLGHDEELRARRSAMIEARTWLRTSLENAGLTPLPSHGNFLNLPIENPAAVCKEMEKKGIIIRPIAAPGFESVRVTISTLAEMQEFYRAFLPVLRRSTRH